MSVCYKSGCDVLPRCDILREMAPLGGATGAMSWKIIIIIIIVIIVITIIIIAILLYDIIKNIL